MPPPNDTSSTAAPPIVVIVGRPNVGKSTLFNRIAGERIAITADEPGTTRDRLFASVDWDDRAFVLVDTGGLEANPAASIGRAIRAQVHAAIDEADAVIFLTDVTTGITPADADVAEVLRKCGKPVALGVNKVDSGKRELQTPEFYRLGLGEPLPVSAHHNQGIGDLLDTVLDGLPEASAPPPVEGVGLAIVGRPNTGKSSLLNALIGEERAIVSDIPGTTRDAVDTVIEYRGQPITVIDTAGVRKRGRVSRGVERFSVIRALRAVERADVAVLLLDVSELEAVQDAHIAGFALDAFKGVVLAVNKWDLARDLEIDQDEAEGIVRRRFKFANYLPLVFISAMRGEGLAKLLRAVLEVHEQRQMRVGTADLNKIVDRAAGEHLPRLVGRKRLHILYATQSGVSPPTFVFFVNDAKLVHFSYHRYLENRIREVFGFTGTPLKFVFRARAESDVR